MKEQFMQSEQQPLHNNEEILQSIQNKAEIKNISPEQQEILNNASKQVQDVLKMYFASVDKISSELAISESVSAPEQIQDQMESHQYTLSDLEKLGIGPGKYFRTPTDDGDSTIRSVDIADLGIVVLSNIDTTKYGVRKEFYTPDQYHVLAEKVSSGVYTPATQGIVPVEKPVVSDTFPTESIPVVSATISEKPHRSLAELLGQGESVPASPLSEPTAPTPGTTGPVIKTDNSPKPDQSGQNFASIEIPIPTETKPVQILPVSLGGIENIEKLLGNERPYQATYKFLTGALQKSWTVTMPSLEPVMPIKTPGQASILQTPIFASTATNTNRLNPDEMLPINS